MTGATERDLTGATIVITGAGSGIGYFAAEGLAARGARIILTGRNADRLALAASMLATDEHRVIAFDLADPRAIPGAADAIRAIASERIDAVIANAGLVRPAARPTGSVLSPALASNLLGHAALIELLLPVLSLRDDARVVSVGSLITSRIRFDRGQLLGREAASPRQDYAMSKHAVEMHGFELARRFTAEGSSTISVVTHPGSAIDALTPDRPGIHTRSAFVRALAPAAAALFSRKVQGKAAAAEALIAAVARRDVANGDYVGPDGDAGPPRVLARPGSADPELGAWMRAELPALTAAWSGS